jgi:hypothetical protein
MSTMKMSIEEIIFQCGGDLAVAYRVRVHQQTVRRWATAGRIPRKYWHDIVKLCGEGCSIRDLRDMHRSKNAKRRG